MDQYFPQSVRKDYLSAEVSSFPDDGTKKVLDSLGKFKTNPTVSQIKDRPYRSNASDNESPGPSLSREKQEAKVRESSYHRTSASQKNAANTSHSQSSRSTSVRYSDDRAARDGKTTGSSHSQTPHQSTSDHLRGSSTTSSTHGSSKSKETGSSNLRGSQRVSKSPKKESSGEKRFEMRDTLKERHGADSSNNNQRNSEQSTSIVQNDSSDMNTVDRFSSAFKREQDELEKRIEELKKEISQQKSKFIEKSSHISEVSLKSEKSKEYVLASSSTHRTATESSKQERKDDRAPTKSLDNRQKSSNETSKVNEKARDTGGVAVKSERTSLSSHGTGTESSKHQNKVEKVSHKSEDYRQRASQEIKNSGSGNTGRQQTQSNDKSRRSRSRSLAHRTEGGDRNIRSRSPRGVSHSRGYRTARSRSRNRDQSPSRNHRSRSIERRSRRSHSRGSRSRRSRSHSTRSHRSGSRDRRDSSKSKSLRDCVSKDKPYMKPEGEKAWESSSLHSYHDQRCNSPVVG